MFRRTAVLAVATLLLTAGVPALAVGDDVSRADADVVYGGPPAENPTFFRGQVVYRSADVDPGELIEVRHLDADDDGDLDFDDAGRLELQIEADADGEVLIFTEDLPPDAYLIVDENDTVVGQFEVVVQRFRAFAFDDDEVGNGGDAAETTLDLRSNRARYRHRISGSLDGENLSTDDLRAFVAAPVLGTADADDDGDDESVVVEGSSNQAIPFDFGGADPGTYRFRTRVADTDATATAVISVADLPPSAADADLEDGGTYFRGQLLYRATLGARETIQVRRVAENGTPGPLQTRFRSDDEGDLFVETDLLPGGRYVLVDPEGDEIVRFEVVLQQFSRFAFADPRVDPGSPGTTLEVASNRERYRHRLSATRDGAELSLADLRAVVDETVLGSADVDDDGVDEAVVLRGRASQSLAVDFGGRPAGTYRFTTRVADATATATATVVVGTGNPFTEPVPGTGASAPPTDPDGDGLFEDVDGDGTVAFEDAIALAFADTAGLNSQQRAALDFDSDGDVDFDDAITLAFEV